jgi:hypothetical protein
MRKNPYFQPTNVITKAELECLSLHGHVINLIDIKEELESFIMIDLLLLVRWLM